VFDLYVAFFCNDYIYMLQVYVSSVSIVS
jgi:hypothetical protein